MGSQRRGFLPVLVSSSSELCFIGFTKCNWVTDGGLWILCFLANGLLPIIARLLARSEQELRWSSELLSECRGMK